MDVDSIVLDVGGKGGRRGAGDADRHGIVDATQLVCVLFHHFVPTVPQRYTHGCVPGNSDN